MRARLRYRRLHAPRSGTPKNEALIDFSFDIGSTNELPIKTTHVLLRRDGAFHSRPLDRIQASYRRRIEYSRTDQVCQFQRPMYRLLCSGDSRHSLSASPVDAHSRHQLGAYRIRKYTQLRSRKPRRFCANDVESGSNSATRSSNRSHKHPTCGDNDASSGALDTECKPLCRSSKQPQ